LFLKGFGEKWVSNKIYIISKKINFIKIKKKFLTKNINVFTPWSILPLHRQNLFRKFSRTKMDVTNNIIKNIFVIPLNNDLKLHQIKRIISVFKSIK
jgi:dTDP-4-amino-4,6-dideoxygalactose transaminase